MLWRGQTPDPRVELLVEALCSTHVAQAHRLQDELCEASTIACYEHVGSDTPADRPSGQHAVAELAHGARSTYAPDHVQRWVTLTRSPAALV
jgi:hypothetical protein